MVQLQKDLEAIEATGTKLVAISYDPVDQSKKFAEAKNISYLLLSDEGSKTINDYGIHNQDGYPHPGTYLIDGSGVVRAEFFSGGIRNRHDNADLIQAAEELN